MAMIARLEITYFGEDFPFWSGTISRMLPDVSYNTATATPSASSANDDALVAASVIPMIAAINGSFLRWLRMISSARNAASLANSFIRCQHILGSGLECTYKLGADL